MSDLSRFAPFVLARMIENLTFSLKQRGHKVETNRMPGGRRYSIDGASSVPSLIFIERAKKIIDREPMK